MIKNIARLKRLFLSKKEKSFLLTIEALIGISPKNLKFYKEAFIHKSSSVKGKNGRYINNERLEYLGDAILDAVVAHIMYDNYPNGNEGFLTSSRAKLVSRNTLNHLGEKLNLGILVQTTSQNNNTNIPGNTLEALIGAVYLDLGYDACKKFIQTKLYADLDKVKKLVKKEQNYKSVLLEWSQKNRHDVEFKLTSEKVDRFNVPTFNSEVYIDNELYAEGEGSSKKESQQQAAKKAISVLKRRQLYR